MGVTVLGIRHHSPACAGLVRRTIERVRPAIVLIEGPSDFNDRLDELRLPHELPIAIFTYRVENRVSESSWTPFCAHSPEWAAIDAAAQVSAEIRFIDLPGWHPAFWGVRNRYADRHDRVERMAATLCARFGVSDVDTLWDHLFEQPMDDEALQQRLRAYFEELRADDAADERDAPREAFMIDCLAAADAAEVIVVCGGWHAPVLERSLSGRAATARAWPEAPALPEDARLGSYLVPFSFHRLDSFTGYESGMPSPAYQDAAVRVGPEHAAETMLASTVARLRKKRQAVSAADLIAVNAMADGLRRLRGHPVVSRIDLLDGLAAGLVKEALEAPIPWTYRGPIKPRTNPLLVEVVAAFAGDRVGKVAEATPRPPLLADVARQIDAHDLVPAPAVRIVALDLSTSDGLARSRVLHRLRVLQIPGFERTGGPLWPTDDEAVERWQIGKVLEAEGALIEAAVHGATLESAAAGFLGDQLLAAEGRLAGIAPLLVEAAFIGIDALAARVLQQVAEAIGTEPSFGDLGAALAALLGLWRYDALLGVTGAPALAGVIAATFERGLWLVEGLRGARAPANRPELDAVLALRDTLLHAGAALGLDRPRAHAVMKRRLDGPDAPPAIRGAALGFLWSTTYFSDAAAGAEAGVRATRGAARPATLGDFLTGLFLLAREETMTADGLLAALDAVLAEIVDGDFLVALPSLRMAFSFFSPAEKHAIARRVLALRGGNPADARDLLRTGVEPELIAQARALEAHVTELARRYGLDAENDP